MIKQPFWAFANKTSHNIGLTGPKLYLKEESIMFRFDEEIFIWLGLKFGRFGTLILNCMLLYFSMTKDGITAYVLGGLWIIHASLYIFKEEIELFIDERRNPEIELEDPFLQELIEGIKKTDE